MLVPKWLTFICAAFVILWGAYRIKVGMRSAASEQRALEKKGLYAMPRRTHILIGIVYVLLGSALAAIGFGWRPFDLVVGGDETIQKAPHSTDVELR